MNSNLRKSEWLDDWFVIDGAEFGQPEGTAEEWKQVIEAIKSKNSCSNARRVAVRRWHSGVDIYSPRNAVNTSDCVVIIDPDLTDWIVHAETLLRQASHEVTEGEAI